MNGKLLLSAVTALASLTASAHTLYVDNQTGHSPLNVYAWGDGPELFGGWPGATSTGTETIAGVTYLKYDMPESDVASNLIFNWDGGQYDGPTITPVSDIYIKAGATSAEVISDPSAIEYNVYVNDRLGWDALYIYAWGNNVPELFGGWPGKASAGTETIEGVTYQKFPFAGNGENYNLIFNNNNATQFDGPSITANADIFIDAADGAATLINDPRVRTCKIYVNDNSGWADLHLYAWADGLPQLFGNWPGAVPSSTETIDGVEYKVFPFAAGNAEYNLIFNNNDTAQFDGPVVKIDKDYFISITSDSFTTGVDTITDADDSEVMYFSIDGVRVMSPDKGIYLMVKGAKTTKVCF